MVLRLEDLLEAAEEAELKREIERQARAAGIELPADGRPMPPPELPR